MRIGAVVLLSAIVVARAGVATAQPRFADDTPRLPSPAAAAADEAVTMPLDDVSHARHELAGGVVLTVLGSLQLVPMIAGVVMAAQGSTSAQAGCPDCGVGTVAGVVMAALSAGVAVSLVTPGVVMIVKGRRRLREELTPAIVPVTRGAGLSWTIAF